MKNFLKQLLGTIAYSITLLILSKFVGFEIVVITGISVIIGTLINNKKSIDVLKASYEAIQFCEKTLKENEQLKGQLKKSLDELNRIEEKINNISKK